MKGVIIDKHVGEKNCAEKGDGRAVWTLLTKNVETWQEEGKEETPERTHQCGQEGPVLYMAVVKWVTSPSMVGVIAFGQTPWREYVQKRFNIDHRPRKKTLNRKPSIQLQYHIRINLSLTLTSETMSAFLTFFLQYTYLFIALLGVRLRSLWLPDVILIKIFQTRGKTYVCILVGIKIWNKMWKGLGFFKEQN